VSSANPWLSWDYVQQHWPELLAAGREHLGITVAAVGLACAAAVPLALLARRVPRLTGAIVGMSGVLYTIPSLALISALWPVFGLTPLTVVIALAIYALLVIVRAILVGLAGVPDETVDSALGMGLSDQQLLWQVQAPLALPSVLAGLRIATVSTVGMVTVGALVGYGGYGTMILAGLNENFYHAKIATATICAIVLAIALDALLLLAERRATPWTRGR
jgi:osmoprotectant transport system permease protein